MSDEIDKLKASMADIADELQLAEQPDVRYGLVAYRDHGDEFVVRNFDFTDSLPQFQRTLASSRPPAAAMSRKRCTRRSSPPSTS
ncbi:MAG: hypothetical protein R2851_13685 [Caldilineaceae bacterium]